MLALADENPRQVPIASFDAAAVVDFNEIAIAAAVPARAANGSVRSRVDRCSIGAGKVNSGVHRGAAAEGIGSDTVTARESGGLHRLVRRNRNRTAREAVELLPAVEKLLERRIGAGRVERTALSVDAGLRRIEAKALERRRIDILRGERGGQRHLPLLDKLHLALGLGGELCNFG